MVLGVPTNFQAVSNVLANYDFVDIMSGTGIINLYAGNCDSGAVISASTILSNNTFYSSAISFSNSFGNGVTDFVLKIDKDFDVIMNRPMNIGGTTVINIPTFMKCQTSDTGTCELYITTIIRKVSGGVESDIVSTTSSTWSGSINNTGTYQFFSVGITVPQTHYKIGDTFRVTINVYPRVTAGVKIFNIYLANDPKGRTSTWDSTGVVPSTLIYQLPVRLNL